MPKNLKSEADQKYHFSEQAIHYLGKPLESLTEKEMRIFKRLVDRQTIARNVNVAFDDKLTIGQRLADKVAKFGGSWTFIFIFAVLLASWVGFNSLAAIRAFDPYPYIFLNLILSMLAAVQAPVIMMSQNRQAAKDRMDAGHDYEINLKAEIEILACLHGKCAGQICVRGLQCCGHVSLHRLADRRVLLRAVDGLNIHASACIAIL